ncbi:response regulator [Collimonas sp. NPDC087041]|uniref:response regulator n=1 Tax=Collimonas sp. NPDC087041 TaxID=3363960 RepID=UPI0037FBF6B9
MSTPSSVRPIRLMLLDDHPVILTGLGAMLAKQKNMIIAGSFTSSSALVDALHVTTVDIILLDYELRRDDVDCFNLIRALKAQFPAIRLLIISAFHRPNIVAPAMRYGADGFVGKEQPFEDVLSAIRALMKGQVYLDEGMQAKVTLGGGSEISPFYSRRHECVDLQSGFSKLSGREQEVLRCCLDGLSVTEIAARFGRSIKTISSQKTSAYKKLGIKNEHELLRLHYKSGAL